MVVRRRLAGRGEGLVEHQVIPGVVEVVVIVDIVANLEVVDRAAVAGEGHRALAPGAVGRVDPPAPADPHFDAIAVALDPAQVRRALRGYGAQPAIPDSTEYSQRDSRLRFQTYTKVWQSYNERVTAAARTRMSVINEGR